MRVKNIVIAPFGNKSDLFKNKWLEQKEEKQFDLCLLFYHDRVDNPQLYNEPDYFFHLKDFKYHMIYKLFTDIQPGWLKTYDYFYFLDDDIKIDTRQINSLFELSHTFGSWISQASLTKGSFCSWPMFKQQSANYCRFVGQIEVMAPLFNAMALEKCLPSFIANLSSWGIDSIWSKILGYPKDKLIVFDVITMEHTKPVGEGELYKKIGVDPREDWKKAVDQYGAKKQNYTEYGRLALINSHNYRWSFFIIKCNELLSRIKRIWNDYDLSSRVRNRLSKFKQISNRV